MLKKGVLRGRNDFSALYNKGKSVGERFIVLFYKKNDLGYTRRAFLASKKVGKAVQRNRARRLMKESVRQLEANMAEGYDYIFIARNTILDAKCADVKRSVTSALKKAGTFTEQQEEKK